MKKVVLALVLVASVIAVSAQPRALGVRGGYGLELSYQHSLGSNMLQVDAGLHGFNGLHAVGTYNWLFSITGGLNWYAGVGAGLGIGGWKDSHLFVGAAGMVGIEYTFNIPLQLSLDYRPIIGINFGDSKIYGDGFLYGAPGLGIRYKF